MLAQERQKRILQLIQSKDIVKVSDIVKEFQVSEITARRDLDILDEKKKLKRVRGGATGIGVIDEDANKLKERFVQQNQENREQKELIGEYAASLVKDGEIIIIDGGSTSLEFAKQLVGKNNVTAIVTAINIAEELEGREGVTTMITGGTLRSRISSLVDPLLKTTLSQIYADKVFIGVRGISRSHGYTTNDFEEAEVKKLLFQSAKEVYIISDSSKFNKVTAAHIGKIDDANYIITDSDLSPSIRKEYSQSSCKILTASNKESSE